MENNNTTLANELIKQAIEEFYQICKHPHPSGKLQEIREFYKDQAAKLGGVAKQDDYGNIWFDVKANDAEYESYPTLILEGHMDMVYAGPHQLEDKPIIPQYHEDGNYLTSKDKITSLGADNGIGIGFALALLKNQKIKHGKIRILLTADEEPGMIGANHLNPDALKNDDGSWIKYLISLDGEVNNGGIYVCCGGGICYTFKKRFDVESSSLPTYEISVSGLKGGHSGDEIGRSRANAERFIFQCLYKLNINKDIQLSLVDHEGKIYQNNAIVANARCIFKSSINEQDIRKQFEELKDFYNSHYQDDKNLVFNLKQVSDVKEAISASDSEKIINMIGNELSYGILTEDGQEVFERSQHPVRSANVGPTSLNNGEFIFEKYDRSHKAHILDVEQKEIEAAFNKIDSKAYSLNAKNVPWEKNPDDKLIKLCKDGFAKNNVESYEQITDGGSEPAVFKRINKDLQLTSLGTRFENVHTVNETCYLNEFENTVNVVLYVIEHLNETNK